MHESQFSTGHSFIGKQVGALWQDGIFYPAVIRSVTTTATTGTSMYTVEFEDRYIKDYTDRQIIGPGFQNISDIHLKFNQKVYVTHGGVEVCGFVQKHRKQTNEVFIKLDDREETLVRKKLEEVRLLSSHKKAEYPSRSSGGWDTSSSGMETKKRTVTDGVDVPNAKTLKIAKEEEPAMNEVMAAMILTSLQSASPSFQQYQPMDCAGPSSPSLASHSSDSGSIYGNVSPSPSTSSGHFSWDFNSRGIPSPGLSLSDCENSSSCQQTHFNYMPHGTPVESMPGALLFSSSVDEGIDMGEGPSSVFWDDAKSPKKLKESSMCHKMDAVCYLLLWAMPCVNLLAFGWQTVNICLFSKRSDVGLPSNSPNDVCSRTVPDSRVSWLSFAKLLFIVALVITHYRGASALATHYCAENQTAELGEQGIIECNFPDNFYRVVWFEDISVNSSLVISCVAPCNVKNGPGFRNKEYDVFQNGSLSISRVNAAHERSYELIVYITSTYFEKLTVFLKVIASPTGLLVSLDGNDIHQQRYQSINGKETLTCLVDAARPPVQLEWIEQTPNGDIVLEQLENIIVENKNGLFNSLVSLHLINSTKHKLMALLVCRARWMQQDWKREKKILLDNSGMESLDSEPKELLYFEINRRAEIRCEGSSGFVNLWKRVLPDNSVDPIGFSLDGATEVTTNSQGIRISPQGSLVFSSPDIDHEGTYVCISSYGIQNQVYVTDFTVLIPPSPPYIQIKGCEDAIESCTLQGSDHHQLVCSVKAVRPAVTLEWIASNTYKGKITFQNQTSVTEKHGETSDVFLSTEYELISQNSGCGDDVPIKCHLQGPVSHIMKSERTIMLSQKACQVDQDEDGGVSILTVVLPVCFGIVLCVLLAACMVWKRKTTTTDSQ